MATYNETASGGILGGGISVVTPYDSYNAIFGLGSHATNNTLRGWWPCQDNAASTDVDDITNRNEGVATSNTSSLTTTGPNTWLPAALDTLNTNHVSVADDSDIDLDYISVGGWFYADTIGTNSMFVCKRTGGNETVSSWDLIRVDASSLVGFRIYLNGASTRYDALSDADLPTGEWVHWKGTFDGSTVRLYKNGVLQATTAAASGVLKKNNVDLWIGAGNDSVNTFVATTQLDGKFAGVSLSSVALTAEEIAEEIDGPEPINTVAPVVSGTGLNFSVTSGTWDLPAPFSGGSNGTITYSYQWTRADDLIGTNQEDISGATSSTYTLVEADNSKCIRCRVRATNDGGFDASADTFSNAIITTTIGTSSRDYSTITLWEADLDDTDLYVSGAHAVGVCYNDSVFDESATINGGSTIGLSSATLTVEAGERHDGTGNTGARVVRSVSSASVFTVAPANASGITYTVEWLEIHHPNLSTGYVVSQTNSQATETFNLRNCIITADNTSGGGGITAAARTGGVITNFCNLICYNINNNGSGSGNDTYGLIDATSSRICNIINCTVWSLYTDASTSGGVAIAIDVQDTASKTIQNVIAGDTQTDNGGTSAAFVDSSYTTATVASLASSDSTASGTGAITSVTGSEFVSTVYGSEDLHLVLDSTLAGAGIDASAVSGSEIDINGIDRTDTGRWSIGAHEGAQTITSSIGTDTRDYSTITLWEADLDDTSVYIPGDAAIGECYNDSAFDESCTVNGGNTIGLISVILTVAIGERHDGTAGTGARIVASSTPRSITMNGDLDGELSWLEIDNNDTSSVIQFVVMGGNFNYAKSTHHLLLHSFLGTGGGNITGINSSGDFATPSQHVIHNCIVYRIRSNSSAFSTVVYGINQSIASRRINMFNNVVYDIRRTDNASSAAYGIRHSDDSSGRYAQNNVVCEVVDELGGNDKCFFLDSPSTAEYAYNASSDGTASGTGSITGVTAADEFVSVVAGSEDFHLVFDSTLANAGTDVSAFPGTEIDINEYDRTETGRWSIGAHEGAITNTKTIGTSGRDYTTITLWEADLDAETVYIPGDAAIGECYNDSAFDESPTISSGITLGLSSVLLTVESGERHDGTAGTGARIVRTGACNFNVSGNAIIPFRMEWLEIDANNNSCSGSTCISLNNRDCTVNHCLMHGIVYTAQNLCVALNTSHFNSSGAPLATFHNCVVYDCESTNGFRSGMIGASAGGGRNGRLYNITAHDMRQPSEVTQDTHHAVCFSISGATAAYNLVGTDPSGEIPNCFEGTPTGFSNNASSDATATGTGSLTNIVTADQYVSIVGGSEDLHLVLDSDLTNAGTDVSSSGYENIELDIDGTDRSLTGRWSIGADEGPMTVLSTIGTNARDYSTMTLWEADLDDTSVYIPGDAARGECYNDSIFDESIVIDGGTTIGLIEITLTVAEGERHDGTASTGARINSTSGATYVVLTSRLDVNVSWLEITSPTGPTTGVRYYHGNNISHLLVHDMRNNTISATGIFAIDNATSVASYVSNCIVWDIVSLANALGIGWGTFSNRPFEFYNNTIYHIETTRVSGGEVSRGFYSFRNASIIAFRNCVVSNVVGTGTNSIIQDFDMGTSVTQSNNASEDGTAFGDDSITGITTADQFVSIVEGSEDLHLKVSSDCIRAGIDLSASGIDDIELDIDGFDRTTLISGIWTIGADDANFPEWYVETGSGGAEIAGDAIVSKLLFETGSGGAEVGGEAPFAKLLFETASGGGELGGEAITTFAISVAGIGGAEIAGVSHVISAETRFSTGGALIGGVADENYTPFYLELSFSSTGLRITLGGDSLVVAAYNDRECEITELKCNVNYPNNYVECFTSRAFEPRQGLGRTKWRGRSAKLPAITTCHQYLYLPSQKDDTLENAR